MKSRSFTVIAFCATTAFAQLATDAPELLIPVAGSTPGANGTFFKSDITLGNFADHSQAVRLTWLPQGATATSTTTITLVPHSFIRSDDFVHDYLSQSGVGAILVTGVTAGAGLDPAAQLYATSRIWS